MSINIPFNKPCFEGNELAYITDAIQRGHISGDGLYTKKCSELFEKEFNCKRALLTTSCTHALEISALLLDLEPGDEVIIPSFTFVSTANAFALHGAKIIFADVQPDTLNIDHNKLDALITPSTKAIVPVHYAGVGCNMDAIMELADRHNIQVIEDNAHGIFGKYNNKTLGSFGSMSTLSFHETKNFTCGEGGALIINDESLVERAEIIREKGTNRSQFFRGQVDKYTWHDLGSSYLPSDILAGFLYAQLEERHQIMQQRRKIWDYYFDNLKEWAQSKDISLPHVPSECQQAYHMFYLLMPSAQDQKAFIDYMKAKGILCVFHYLPLHLSTMGLKYGGKTGDCPITEDISNRLVRLPFYNNLSTDEQAIITDAIRNF